MTPELDLTAYLRRLGLPEAATPAPTVDTLRQLHRAHVDTFPFVNIEAALGRVPELDLPALQERMVAGGRGGYCMEHVALFAAALDTIGFPVALRLCLVGAPTDPDRPPTHLTVLARPSDDRRRWMADVGFGLGVLGPVPVPEGPGEGEPVRHGNWVHRADLTDDGRVVLMEHGSDGWQALHASTDRDVEPAVIEDANRWVALEPRSPFAGKLVAMRTTDERRERLRGTMLDVVEGHGEPQAQELTPDGAVDALRERFGVRVADADRDALKRLVSSA